MPAESRYAVIGDDHAGVVRTASGLWRSRLRRAGLRTARDFLELPGDIVSGHRDRHVREVLIGGRRCFLKVEHRVPWTTRWHNWRAGAGFTSLSEREAATLRELRHAGVSVPSVVAFGRDDRGRAFLALQAAPGRGLAAALKPGRLSALARWRLAQAVGEAVGRVHRAGFDAPDLSAKHVIVRRCGSVTLIDWPRARRRPTLAHDQCLMALAGIHASLPESLAGPRERLRALKAWMHEVGFHGPAAPWARRVMALATIVADRRSIRDQRSAGRAPRLRWLAGESLCVSPTFQARIGERVPDWLIRAATTPVSRPGTLRPRPDLELTTFPAASLPARGIAALLGRPLVSPGIRLAGLVHRWTRQRLPVVPVAAFGGRPDGGGFLLVVHPKRWMSARQWLAVDRPGRHEVLAAIGRLVRQCRENGAARASARRIVIDLSDRPRPILIPGIELLGPRTPFRHTELDRLADELGLTAAHDRAALVSEGAALPRPETRPLAGPARRAA